MTTVSVHVVNIVVANVLSECANAFKDSCTSIHQVKIDNAAHHPTDNI